MSRLMDTKLDSFITYSSDSFTNPEFFTKMNVVILIYST